MIIFPAIDLKQGKAVRLFQGDYERMTVFSDSPLDVAKSFQEAGATHLHLVDLDGAKDGTPGNLPVIREIVSSLGLAAQVGGGIRTLQTAEQYLSAGVQRLIVGTAALKDRAFLRSLLAAFGERVAVGVDVRDGFVAVEGWRETSGTGLHEFMQGLSEDGVSCVICTDISRDGAMKGTNRSLYKELSALYGMDIIASGGVSSLEDVRALGALKLYGAIIGKALYTGDIILKAAIDAAKAEEE